MKRLLSTLVLALMVLMCFYGCEKEGVRKVRVEMTPFNGGKLTIDNDYSLNWSAGDGIAVQGDVYVVDNSHVSVTSEDGTLYALYPASAMKDYANGVYDVEIPRVQTYQVENGKQVVHPLMAAKGDNSLLFEHVCSLLKVQVPEITGMTVQYIDITTDDGDTPLSGQGQVTLTGDTPTFAFSSGNTYPYVRLDCGEGVSGTVFYIVVPPIDSKKLKVILTVKGSSSHLFRDVVIQSSPSSLARGWCGPVQIPSSFHLWEDKEITAPENALCEYFSMSETTKVFFSKGNLQYKAADATWSIADTQYLIRGYNNRYISETNSRQIDLFGWGTTGIPTISPEPTETSTTDAEYSIDNGAFNDITPEYDWGKHIGDGWRTPTYAEWSYLLTNHNVAHATVDTVKGIVILPDYWILPEGCSFNLNNNTYSGDEWGKMERYGALFLPAAGRRNRLDVSSVNKHGYYWASTKFDPSKAYSLYLYNSGISVQEIARHYGCSVRLVKNK